MRTYRQFALKRIEFLINLLLYMENKEIKEMVKQKYSALALQMITSRLVVALDAVPLIMCITL